jgi:hypothetical protein
VRCCRPVRTTCCRPCCHTHHCVPTCGSAAVVGEVAAPSDCGCGGAVSTEMGTSEMGTVVEPQPAGDVMMEQPVTAPPAEPAVPVEAPAVPEAPNEG